MKRENLERVEESADPPKPPILLLAIPDWLETAIKDFNETNWDDGCDPSGFGGVNAAAYIGERIAAIYKNTPKLEEVGDAKREGQGE